MTFLPSGSVPWIVKGQWSLAEGVICLCLCLYERDRGTESGGPTMAGVLSRKKFIHTQRQEHKKNQRHGHQCFVFFIHSFIHSFIRSFVRSFIRSFVQFISHSH